MSSLLLYLQVLLTGLGIAPPQASVRPLFNAEHRIVCTASSINSKIGLWLTAQHCKGPGRLIGQPDGTTWHYHAVSPVYVNDEADIAVLLTDTLRVEALPLATKEPVVDAVVLVLGYSMGYEALQRFHGYVSNVATPVVEVEQDPFTGEQSRVDYGIKTTFGMPSCGGNSGSPILDADGAIVSVLQLGFSPACSAVTAGVPYVKLSALVGKFFER